MNKLDFKT